jgi:hypothetical protein
MVISVMHMLLPLGVGVAYIPFVPSLACIVVYIIRNALLLARLSLMGSYRLTAGQKALKDTSRKTSDTVEYNKYVVIFTS